MIRLIRQRFDKWFNGQSKTIEGIAEDIKMSRRQFEKILEGQTIDVKLSFVEGIARLMNISVWELLREEKETVLSPVWRSSPAQELEPYLAEVGDATTQAGGKGKTIVYGRFFTLRVMQKQVRESHNKVLFFSSKEENEWNQIGEKLAALNTVHFVNVMLESWFDKFLKRDWPFHHLTAADIVAQLEHLRDQWLGDEKYQLCLVSDRQVKEKDQELWQMTQAWDSVAVVSTSLGILRAQDMQLFFTRSTKLIKETRQKLDRLLALGQPVDKEVLNAHIVIVRSR